MASIVPQPGGNSNPTGGEHAGPLAAAQCYYDLGWDVRPAHTARTRADGTVACSCTAGAACDKPGKHPKGYWGVNRPAPDWRWRGLEWRGGANFSLLTGRRSGVIVADIDPRHDGMRDALWALGWPQETVIACTGGGGWHVYAACPPEGEPSVDAYAPGIELKADGKQVIIPPSIHPSGRPYTWMPGHEPWHVAVATLPADVLGAIAATRRERTATKSTPREPGGRTASTTHPASTDPVYIAPGGAAWWALRFVEKAIQHAKDNTHGGRNNTGLWLACQLRDLRLPADLMELAMVAYQREVRWLHA